MKKSNITFKNAKAIRLECSEMLSRHQSRIKLIFGILIFVATLMYYNILAGFMEYGILPALAKGEQPQIVWAVRFGYYLFLALYCFFFTLPLFCGLIKMAMLAERKKDFELLVLFSSFADKQNYRKSLMLSIRLLWKLVLLILCLDLTNFFFFEVEYSLLTQVFVALLMGLEILLWLYFISGSFGKLYRDLSDEAPSALRMPKRCWRRIAIRYWIDFLPWILLSVLTVCILLVADTLPRMLLAYAHTCNRYNETLTQNKGD